MKNRRWIIAIVAAILVIAGVAVAVVLTNRDGAPTAESTQSPTPTATPSPTPTATPTPSATPTPQPQPTRPALDELVLTESALGTLTLATDPTTYDPATSLVEQVPWQCDGSGTSGVAWMPVLEGSVGDGKTPFQTTVNSSGMVGGITIGDPALRTDRGARPGMTWQEIAPLYPEAIDTSAGGNGSVHAFSTASGTMFFYSGGDGPIFTIGITTTGLTESFKYPNMHGFYAFCL